MLDVRALLLRLRRPRGVLLVGALAVLVALWASAVPRPPGTVSGAVFGGPSDQQGYDDTENPTVSEMLGNAYRGPREGASVLEGILGYAVVAMLAAILLVCLVLVVKAFVATRDRPAPPADEAPDLDLEALAVAVARGSDDRLAALSAGTPAEGVIAAWAHLEAALHTAKVPLASSRTSTEVTLDVLRRFDVDDATVRGLAALYREARWSRHELTEADRARAAAAYRDLEAAVRPATATVPGAGARG